MDVTKNNYNETEVKNGYKRAVDIIRYCSTPEGFIASPVKKDNYRRIWGRDGVIIGLAALLTGEKELIETFRETLRTLAKYQGPHGEIPSNVDTDTGRISYGGMIGRVDADLWFIIGCGEFWMETGDNEFIIEMMPAIESAFSLLGAWEFNNRGLIYVPETGDWADEYIHEGFVLYDQLLYFQAMRTVYDLRVFIDQGKNNDELLSRIKRLKKYIKANYWLTDEAQNDGIYHEILYKKGLKAREKMDGLYWMPFFSPHGYGYRFDSFANILASLLGVANTKQADYVDNYISEIINHDFPLLPAFHPVIRPVDKDWEELKMTFSYTFKNRPYEYHNGGLWQMITGFYVADLVKRGKTDLARECLSAINRANKLPMDNEEWSFPEYVHGFHLTADGMKHQGWSAAAAVIGYRALNNISIFKMRVYE